MDFSKLLKPMQKSSIIINYDIEFNGECQIGSSKIGGKPDLPLDFKWFYFRGKSYDDIIDNRPLSFLAQINCEEAYEYDKGKLLPSKGMFYFFYELRTMTWGGDPNDKGSAKVYYYPGSVSELCRTEFPSDLPEEFRLFEMQIDFSSGRELPDFDEFMELHDKCKYKQIDKYDAAKIKMGFDSEEEEQGKINKLFGYANLIQGGMLLGCEKITNGIYTGEPNKIPKNELRQYKETCTKWQLLFQLDSIQTKNYEMLWGDIGQIYYYINIEDLNKLDFDNCWLMLQCY